MNGEKGFVVIFTGEKERRQFLRRDDDKRRAAVFPTRKAAFRASQGLRHPEVVDLSGDLNICVINQVG